MAVRVLVPNASQSGERIELPHDEAAHVSRVLRLSSGDALRVFDGRGGEWLATVAAVTRGAVSVVLAETVPAAPETSIRYTVALAVLKGDGTDDAIRDAVMMGVSHLRPFVSARCGTTADLIRRTSRLDRWRRVAMASAKQCGRAVVPSIAAPSDFGALSTSAADELRLLLVEPDLSRPSVAIVDVPAPRAVTLAIGPEGGWAPDEVTVAQRAGWTLVGLGGRTLRATSAPLVALAACQAVWRDT